MVNIIEQLNNDENVSDKFKVAINSAIEASRMRKIEDVKRICEKIGLITLEDVAFFQQKIQCKNETLYEALLRYEKEFDSII